MRGLQFLEATPVFALDELQVAPWPVQLQVDGIKSCTYLPAEGVIKAVPKLVTEKAYEGSFFANIDRNLFGMYNAIKTTLSGHSSERLFKAALQSANPYAELFGTILRSKELSTFRFLEIGLSCQLFAHLDRAVRSLLTPSEAGQYTWNFVAISPYLYMDGIRTYLETRVSDVPLGQVRSKIPLNYICIYSRKESPRCTYSKIPFKALQGPSIDDFSQVEKLRGMIVSATHSQGAHFLLLEYDPPIPSTELYSNYVQYSHLPYFMVSVLLAISPNTVKFGGSCIFKTTDLWSPIHAELLHLCEACYEYVAICKTVTMRILDTERWVVLKGRNRNIYDIDYASFISSIEKIINVTYPKTPKEPFTFCNSVLAPFLQRSTHPIDIFNNTESSTSLAQYIFYANNSVLTLQTSLYIQALLLHSINRKNYASIIQFIKEYASVLTFSGVPAPAESSKSRELEPPPKLSETEEVPKDEKKQNSDPVCQEKHCSSDNSSEMMAFSEGSDQDSNPLNTHEPHEISGAVHAAVASLDHIEENTVNTIDTEAVTMCERLNQTIGKHYTEMDISTLEHYLMSHYSVRPRQVIPYQSYRDRMFGCLRELLTMKPDTRSIEYIIGKDSDRPGSSINWSKAELLYSSTAQLVEREQEMRKAEAETKARESARRKDGSAEIIKIGGLTTINDTKELAPGSAKEPERKQRAKRASSK